MQFFPRAIQTEEKRKMISKIGHETESSSVTSQEQLKTKNKTKYIKVRDARDEGKT